MYIIFSYITCGQVNSLKWYLWGSWDLCVTLTYPSSKSQFSPKWEVSVNADLGEGYVVCYLETWIDQYFFEKFSSL